MVLEKEEVDARLNSNDNLINRLRALTAEKSEIVCAPKSAVLTGEIVNHPSLPPPIDELVGNVDEKIADAKTVASAKKVLSNAIDKLDKRLIEVDSPAQLARIATDMGKIVNVFSDVDKNKNSNAPVIIWKPVMNQENHYGDMISAVD